MNINETAKLRLSFKSVCHLLDIGRDGLNALVEKDPTFPRPIKDGSLRQSQNYFDYAEVMAWYEAWRQLKQDTDTALAGALS